MYVEVTDEEQRRIARFMPVSAEQKRMQSEVDGDAHADGVVTYVEVWARPDNDVSRDLCPPQRSRNRCETGEQRENTTVWRFLEAKSSPQGARGEGYAPTRGVRSVATE